MAAMTPGLIARSFRRLCLLPHVRGKSRLEALIEPRVPVPAGRQPIDFPSGMRLELDLESTYERGFYFRNCEADTCATIEALLRPGMRFVDCGANIGFYSIVAASRVGAAGEVSAFEPTPSSFARVERNIALNRLGNAKAFPFALGAADGSAEVYQFDPRFHGLNTLAKSNGATAIASCRVRALDSLLDEGLVPPPHVMKIDVEGSEWNVLRGAERLLRSPEAPILILELSRLTFARFGYTPEELLAWLRSRRDFRLEWPFFGRRAEVAPGARLPHYEAVDADFAANYVLYPR